ncbi:hypothetical protein SMGD1_0576 [Sulfurimonas gotlandica GD1]|jgi:hypothetical protein|uniref:Uncharacterized protein n=1 Tax=Sulfurimonas gotlandica (strain DSM 19862 / JCM 16533 / GD1) TaxID=929558 RepID=H1FVQ5_SULGG|nr:hypothetical protein [Sulfurimonas gotlandica]EHP29103.1 hypothetical protein SMGD1_0576 [Sulfurimonas gotlandica GD1]
MNTNQNILSSVLLASSLTLTPIVTTSLTASTQFRVNSISNSISKNLHRRGIDEDISKKIANNIFTVDEELFALMLQNLQHGCDKLTRSEIMDFLSTQALLSKNVNLDSYSYLVNMIYQIKHKALTKKDLKSLNTIATKNSLYAQGWF